jgi:hypothetical protein
MSLFLSTCSLINSSLNVITGFKQVNAKFAMILQPHKGLRISDNDRRRVVSVHKRLECLIEPLNFCVLWVRDKDSCIFPILQYSSDLIESVIDFLDKVKFTTDDLDPFVRVLDPESRSKVDYFLRELDFACNSISVAVSIAKSFSINDASSTGRISPSALLKASTRITEMMNRSGDLCAFSGTLFQRPPGGTWTETSREATLKISQFKAVDPSDCPYLIRVSWDSSSLNFPIQTALSLRVSSCRDMQINLTSPTDSISLTWAYKASPGRLLHRNPSGALDPTELSLDSSDEDTLVVRGAAEVPRTLRARISSTHINGSETGSEFAFVYNTLSCSLSPLDVVYIARLCVLESMRRTSPISTDSTVVSSPRSVSQNALHLEASDETLSALLVDARIDIIEPSRPIKPEIDLVVSED